MLYVKRCNIHHKSLKIPAAAGIFSGYEPCPKCAFVFLILTPFIAKEKLENLWNGKNLLLDPSLEKTYRQLLGIEGDKPLDCVGEIKESRAAMRLAQQIYPELKKYQFELPDEYDYRKLSPHSMPEEIAKILLSVVQL